MSSQQNTPKPPLPAAIVTGPRLDGIILLGTKLMEMLLPEPVKPKVENPEPVTQPVSVLIEADQLMFTDPQPVKTPKPAKPRGGRE